MTALIVTTHETVSVQQQNYYISMKMEKRTEAKNIYKYTWTCLDRLDHSSENVASGSTVSPLVKHLNVMLQDKL